MSSLNRLQYSEDGYQLDGNLEIASNTTHRTRGFHTIQFMRKAIHDFTLLRDGAKSVKGNESLKITGEMRVGYTDLFVVSKNDIGWQAIYLLV